MKGISAAQASTTIAGIVSKAQETEGLQYLLLRFEPVLRIQGSAATGTCSSNCLAVGVINSVATGEDTRKASCGTRVIDQDVTGLVQSNLTGNYGGAGKVTDGNENTIGIKNASRIINGGTQANTGHGRIAQNLFDDGVPREFDLLIGQCAIGHGLRRTQLITAMNDSDL